MSKPKILADADIQIAQAWREIADLRKAIDEKTRHVDMLTKQGLRPYFTDDMPIKEWQAIGMRFAAIGTLTELKHLDERRRCRPRKRKP